MSGSAVATSYSCGNYFNRIYFCATAGYQFRAYYRDGHFDDCSGAFDDFYKCLQVKISKDEDARKLVKELEEKSEPKRHVWPMRELPRKDFKFKNTEVWDEAPCADVQPVRRWPPPGVDVADMPSTMSTGDSAVDGEA